MSNRPVIPNGTGAVCCQLDLISERKLEAAKSASPLAVALYTKERDAWPESRGLMDALINNVGKRDNSKAEAKL